MSLDQIFILNQLNNGNDVQSFCKESPKLEVLLHSLYRKGLITKELTITLSGTAILEFIEKEPDGITVQRRVKIPEDAFERWWKTYPGTDTFTHKTKKFTGTRSLRMRKEECRVKFEKIMAEGTYTLDELIVALEYEVTQKKNNSVKSGENKLTFMQNSLTYLNQRAFEPFIELIREGARIEEINNVSGGTDI